MASLSFLPQAYDDLRKLDEYHVLSGGREPFPSDAVLDKVALLETYPLMGPMHQDPVLAGRGFRKLLAGRWATVYRVEGDQVIVYRVFHQRSNYAAGQPSAV